MSPVAVGRAWSEASAAAAIAAIAASKCGMTGPVMHKAKQNCRLAGAFRV